MPRCTLTPYQRILRAAARGEGVHFSAADARTLAADAAIETIAWQDDEAQGRQLNSDTGRYEPWKN